MSQQSFWRTVTRDGKEPCAMRGSITSPFGPCLGKKDAHHYFPKRRIRNQLGRRNPRLEDALADSRNGVCLCRAHHDLVEQPGKARICPRPSELTYFLAEYGLYVPVRQAAGRPK